MIYALVHLHDLSIVHRDIKTTNILLVSRPPFVAKLADFDDTAHQVADLETLYGTSTILRAPEMWKDAGGLGQYGATVDIWSLGIGIIGRRCP